MTLSLLYLTIFKGEVINKVSKTNGGRKTKPYKKKVNNDRNKKHFRSIN